MNMLDHMPPMKVKGLLKGLRYISQIFDGEKEQEMVIGNPTNVKHVAHIGWDGPAVTSPSWITDFSSGPLSNVNDGKEVGSQKPAIQEMAAEIPGGIPSSPARDEVSSPKPRRTRRHASSEAAGSDSPSRDHSSRGARHCRKNQSTGSAPGSDSPVRESESRRGRRHSKPDSVIGSESPARDLPTIPKQARKKERRAKGSDGGSGCSPRSKNPSFPEAGQEERIALPVMVEEAAV